MTDPEELDVLLSDIQRLLDEPTAGGSGPAPRPAKAQPGEDPAGAGGRRAQGAQAARQTPEGKPWEQPGYTGVYYGPGGARRVQSASAGHAPPPPPERPLQSRLRNEQAERFAVPQRPEPAYERPEPSRRRRSREPAYEQSEPSRRRRSREPDPPARPEKRRHVVRNAVLILLLLAIAVPVLLVVFARQPVSGESRGERKPGVSTILLAGVDEGGQRTDTLLLLTADRENGRISLVSIPRDTLIQGPYSVPKINGVYGINGGGEEGINMLLQRVGECIGFRPDGYVLVDLEGFVDLVEAMGGVEFDVPQDMYYDDPAQDLHIALDAGRQKLDGEQAMGLVRFRSGYAEADLKRVSVQRDFVIEAAKQWFGPKLLFKAPSLLSWTGRNVETDLSASNLIWLAKALYGGTSDMTTDTLPGSASYIQGGSYYVLDPPAVAELINRRSNPYKKDIDWTELNINH